MKQKTRRNETSKGCPAYNSMGKRCWMKGIRQLLTGFFCLFFLIAIAPGAMAAKVVLKMASEGPDNPPPQGIKQPLPGAQTLKRFAELVKLRSKGEIEIEVFFGTLGPAKQLFAASTLGTLDIVGCDSAILSYFKGGENFSIMWAPYLFETPEEFSAWLDSDMARGMMASIEKNLKIKILGSIHWRPSRMLTTTNTPVQKVEDMKGLKIRVPPSRIFNEIFSAWGAIPTPLSFTELFMALKQGVISGQDNGWDAIVFAQFYSVQKYAVITGHGMAGYLIAMSQATWDRLTPAQRKLIEDVRKEVYVEQIPQFKEALAGYAQYATNQGGMTVIHPDLSGFKKIGNEINLKLDQEGKLWEKGLYKKVQDWLIQHRRKK